MSNINVIERAGTVMAVNEQVLAVFTSEAAVDDLLQPVRDLIADFEPDIATHKGRKDIASLAHKIARYKTTLDSHGKDLVADWKKKSSAVDASRKTLRDELDEMKAQVRKPLTDWEEAEKRRIENHKAALSRINELAELAAGESAEKIGELIEKASMIEPESFQEYEAEAIKALRATRVLLSAELVVAKEREEKERKAEEARAAAEKKARDEREAQIRAEAEARAKAEAEAAAQAEKERIEREKAEAERQARDAIAAQKKAEQYLARAEEQAKAQAEEAAIQAREDEQRRAAEQAAKEKAAQEKREADRRHIGLIHKQTKESLMQVCSLDEGTAKKVVLAIAAGKIKNVTINY